MTLDALALRYAADKSSDGHDYARFYERHIPRDAKLLEIGVGSGASLKMWRDWLINGEAFAIDNSLSHCNVARAHGFTCFQGDQADAAFVADVIRRTGATIVIDDGSHRASDQHGTLHAALDALPTKGLLAIEDLHTAYWTGWGSILADLYNEIDSMNDKGCVEDGKLRRRLLPKYRVEAVHFYPCLAILEFA